MNSFIETPNQLGSHFLIFAVPMLWQSSLLIAVVFGFDFLLARKIRASVRYALWLAVLAKLLLPPTLALPTSAAWWLFPAKLAAPAPAVKNFIVTYDTAPPQMDLVPQTISLPKPPASKLNLAGWFLFASGAVSLSLLLWLAARWWQVARKIRKAPACGEFSKLLDEARQLAGLRSPARLKIAEDRMSPAVCGLFRPMILLPRALASELSPAQLRAVLLHELIHLRRRDVWVNCAQALLQIFYWWHPLLWLANARIRRLREEAVDDAVMLALREEADSYAPTLLEVAKLAFRRPLMSLGLVGIMESRSALRQRIERLVDFRAPRKAGLTFASLCGIFVFSAVALPMGEAPVPPENETSSAPRTVLEKTNLPAVLIQAEIYRMRQADFEKLVSDPAFVSTRKDEVNNFHQFERLVKTAGLSPILRPRIQTTSGQPAQFYVGNEVNSIEFECLPLATNGLIQLANHIKIVSTAESVTTTNNTDTQTTLQNGGGQVFSIRPPDETGQSNLVVVTVSAEIVTNAARFQQRLQAIIKRASQDAVGNSGNLVQDGKVLYEMGKFDEAEARLKAALAKDSNNPSAKYYLNLVQDAKQSRTSSTNNNLHYTGLGRQAIVAKLNHIRLDNVSFDSLPLTEVLKQLSEQSRLHDPEHQGINFLINNDPNSSSQPPMAPSVAPQLDPITGLPIAPAASTEPAEAGSFLIKIPSLKHARLADVLDAIVLAADHPIKYSVQDFAVVFAAKGPETPQLFARTFRVDAHAIVSAMKTANPNLADLTNEEAIVRKFMTNLGVNLESPAGKAVYFNDRGILYVKATEADFDAIERALGVLDSAPPQIHIKARFLEVPKGTLAGFGNFLNSTNHTAAQLTGILTAANAKEVLHSLLSQAGVEVLSEPEATLISGRQVQMRATQVVTVVTNLAFQAAWTNQDGMRISNSIVPQTSTVETGPILDAVPYVLSDGYTINLTLIPSDTEFLGYDQSTNATAAYDRAREKIDVPGILPNFRVRKIVTTLNLWDGQTAVIGNFPEKIYGGEAVIGNSKASDKELLLLVTVNIVDPAGNRVHSDDEMPFAQRGTPPQPK